MMRVLPFVVAVVLIAICTAGQAIFTQRYTGGTSTEMQALADRFDLIRAQTEFGDWRKGEDGQLSELDEKAAGARNYISTTYTNRATKQSVSVFMICGFGRDVAVHTPDRCFVGSGMKMQDEAAKFEVDYKDRFIVDAGEDPLPRTMEFKAARFIREESNQDQRTYWAWNAYRHDKENWAAPGYPRAHYGGGTPLAKIYITVSTKGNTGPPDAVADQFAQDFLPEVSSILGAPLEEEELVDAEETPEA